MGQRKLGKRSGEGAESPRWDQQVCVAQPGGESGP